MKYLRIFAVFGLVLCAASFAHAQRVVVGVGFGGPEVVAGPPVCSYGYYAYAPYGCAPYGYYGPEWFSGGLFIGAGPWFHGPAFWGGRTFYDRGWNDFHAGIGWHGYGRGFRGGPVGGFHGAAGGFHGGAVEHGGGGFHGPAGGFHGGGSFHGNGGFHGGGGGGFHGGRR